MNPLCFSTTVSAPPHIVYHAFTNETVLRQWLCDGNHVIPHEGGPYFLRWNSGYFAAGEFLTLKPHSRIAFTWQGRGQPSITQVEVALTPEGEGTHIEIQHSGIDEGGAWDETRWQIKYGWESGLENLKFLLETGLDLRLMRRPLLGISVGEFNAETARQLGVPVTEGVRIAEVMDGLGARRAGLQAGDVLVSLGGRPVKDWTSLMNILAHYQGGDTVAVVFYRGGEMHTADMILSKRPEPKIPSGPAELADSLRAIHAELDTELDALVAGVPEAHMSWRPAADEWSANEVLAHLIWTERFMQMWLWGMVNNDEAARWTENNNTQIAGILAVHPTSGQLAAEFKRAQAEKAAAVLAIPPAFTAYKGTFARLATDLIELKDHTRQHFEQMRRAIAAARQAELSR